jgi:hypothetical protein
MVFFFPFEVDCRSHSSLPVRFRLVYLVFEVALVTLIAGLRFASKEEARSSHIVPLKGCQLSTFGVKQHCFCSADPLESPSWPWTQPLPVHSPPSQASAIGSCMHRSRYPYPTRVSGGFALPGLILLDAALFLLCSILTRPFFPLPNL